jgi:hypothetical protein
VASPPESGMSTSAGSNQLLLLPEVVDDFVHADNPVRFIDAFLGGLDLAAARLAEATTDCRHRYFRISQRTKT